MNEELISPGEPIRKGKYIFHDIQEGEGEGSRRINFVPPLIVEYSIWEKIDKISGKDNYVEDTSLMGYAEFDFGMDIKMALDKEHNVLVSGYNGLTEDSDPVDILMKSIWYDLFHAFCKSQDDPNYNHYHWALYGNLNDRTSIQE